jgi:NADH-quinone oxidoreductase subunit K
MVPITYYLALSAMLFILGVIGVLLRRNVIVVFMSLELMFNAANMAFVAFAAFYSNLTGQLMVFFIMIVAAAEVAIGLALLVAIFRAKHSVDVDQMSALKG